MGKTRSVQVSGPETRPQGDEASSKRTNLERIATTTPRHRGNKPSVGILTLPVAKTGVVPLRNLAKVIQSMADRVYVVTGGDGYYSLEGDPAFRVVKVDHR